MLRAIPFCRTFAIAVALAAAARAERPTVALAGFRYVRWHAEFVEAIGGAHTFLRPDRLRQKDELSRFATIVVCRQDDEDASGPGLSPEVAAALAEYVRAGGRLLLTYGCAPPEQVLTGNFALATRGGKLVVKGTHHPITSRYVAGEHIAYGAAHYLMEGLPPDAQVLLRWDRGPAAMVAAPHGKGEVICASFAFALCASGRGDVAGLLLRTLRYLVHGSPDARVGGPPAESPASLPEGLRTKRQLVAPDSEAATLSFGTLDGWSWDVAPGGLDVRAEGQGLRTLLIRPGRPAALGPWGTATRKVIFRAPHGATIEVPVHLAGTGHGSFVACEARWLGADGAEEAATLPISPFVMGKAGRHRLICRLPAPQGRGGLKVRLRFSTGSGALRIEVPLVRALPDFDQLFKSGSRLTLGRPPRCFATPKRIERLKQWIVAGEPGPLGLRPERLLRPVVGSAKRSVNSDRMTVKGTVVAMPPTEFVDFKGLTRTHVSAEMERRLRALAVAYAVTGERQFGERCREYALALASWPSWPTHRLAFGMAPAYDLAHDLFSDEERSRIREALVRCVMRPMAERFWGRGLTSDHNGTVVPAASFAAATLAIGGEQAGSAACAAVAEDLLVEFLDRRWNTGDHEGPGYDGYTLSHVVPALEAFRMGLGVDHLAHPYLDECVRMASAFLSPSRRGVVGFGDVGYTCWEVVAATLAAVKRNPLAGWYASESLAFTRYRALRLLYWDGDAPKAAASSLPRSVSFPKQGLVALRSDRSEQATLMAFISSSCPHGHIHLAQNHFRLFRGDQELACRPGYSSNITGAAGRYARGTHAHNTITVDGAGQTSRRGKLLRTFTSPAVDYIVGDATDAYGTGMLSRCRRHIVFLKPDTFIIIDDLRTSGTARRFEWRYHPEYATSPAEITIGGETVGEEQFVGAGAIACKRGSQRATIRFLAPAGVRTTCQPCPFSERQGRELISTAPRATEQVFVTLISLGPARPERGTRELPFVTSRAIESAELCSRDGEDGVALSFHGAARGAMLLRLSGRARLKADGLQTDAVLAVRLNSTWADGSDRELWLLCGGTFVSGDDDRTARIPRAGAAALLRRAANWSMTTDLAAGTEVQLPDGTTSRVQ